MHRSKFSPAWMEKFITPTTAPSPWGCGFLEQMESKHGTKKWSKMGANVISTQPPQPKNNWSKQFSKQMWILLACICSTHGLVMSRRTTATFEFARWSHLQPKCEKPFHGTSSSCRALNSNKLFDYHVANVNFDVWWLWNVWNVWNVCGSCRQNIQHVPCPWSAYGKYVDMYFVWQETSMCVDVSMFFPGKKSWIVNKNRTNAFIRCILQTDGEWGTTFFCCGFVSAKQMARIQNCFQFTLCKDSDWTLRGITIQTVEKILPVLFCDTGPRNNR